MISLKYTQLWVHNQDEALEFYTKKVGFEVRDDITVAEMGNFRWLAVGPASQPDVNIVLMDIPGVPIMDDETNRAVHELTAKGFSGTVFLVSDNLEKDYQELEARGVEFIEKPTQRPYGLDCAFRDPSGNHLRIAQL